MLRLPFRASALILLFTLFLALPACDEVTGGGNEEEEPQHDPALVGQWIAISALFTSVSNASVHFDGILEGGGFMYIVFDADGTVNLTEWDGDLGEMVEDPGTWYTESGGRLVVTWSSEGGPDTVSYQIVGGNVVVNVGEEDIDLNGDGIDDLANFVITFADITDSPDPALVGTWSATAMVFTSEADPGTSVDVTEFGATFELVARADGTYTVTFVYPDEPTPITEIETGVYTALDGLLWVYDSGSADPEIGLLFYDVAGSDATLFHAWDQFDFNDDGTEEPATLEIILAKQ